MFEFGNNLFATQQMEHYSIKSHAHHIRKMFAQANNDLSSFLRHLNFVYHSFGINFDATQYHNVVLRIISPYQLLTHFKIKNIKELINFRYLDYIQKQDRNQIQDPFQQSYMPRGKKIKNIGVDNLKNQLINRNGNNGNGNDNGNGNGNDNNGNNGHEKEQKNKKKQKQQRKSQQYQEDQHYQQNCGKIEQNKISYRINYGARPILQPEQQLRIQKFIISQVQRGRSLSMQQIADYAKNITQKKYNLTNFLGSIGWVRNFMRRYPKMRDIYMKSKLNKQKNKPQKKSKKFNKNQFYFRASNIPNIKQEYNNDKNQYQNKYQNQYQNKIYNQYQNQYQNKIYNEQQQQQQQYKYEEQREDKEDKEDKEDISYDFQSEEQQQEQKQFKK